MSRLVRSGYGVHVVHERAETYTRAAAVLASYVLIESSPRGPLADQVAQALAELTGMTTEQLLAMTDETQRLLSRS